MPLGFIGGDQLTSVDLVPVTWTDGAARSDGKASSGLDNVDWLSVHPADVQALITNSYSTYGSRSVTTYVVLRPE